MKNLLAAWNEIESLLSVNDLFLFLDYDGTITPIVDVPDDARITETEREALRGISRAQGLRVFVVSGRSLEQLRRFVGIEDLVYVGNHGLEIEGPGIRFLHPSAVNGKDTMSEVCADLVRNFSGYEGIFVENKSFTLSVHYRRLAEERIDKARMLFLKTLHPYLSHSRAFFTEGKKVWEVRPALEWNKGQAVSWLFSRLAPASRSVLPVYIGDDRTDESALNVVRSRGIGVKMVGEEPEFSHAGFFLSRTEELYEFLDRLKKLKGEAA